MWAKAAHDLSPIWGEFLMNIVIKNLVECLKSLASRLFSGLALGFITANTLCEVDERLPHHGYLFAIAVKNGRQY
jgi:hypothetical protein